MFVLNHKEYGKEVCIASRRNSLGVVFICMYMFAFMHVYACMKVCVYVTSSFMSQQQAKELKPKTQH